MNNNNNSNNYNNGNYNSGNYNGGNYNSGNYNSDNYNSGNYQYNNEEVQLMNELSSNQAANPYATANPYADENSNFFLAIVGGSVVAFICSLLWAAITYLTDYQFGIMAIGVGFLVGSSIKVLGKGKSSKFGILGALLSTFSCFLGNLIYVYAYFAKIFAMSFFDAIGDLPFSEAISIVFKASGLIDILFYILAIYIGYKSSIKN
ncbi:hypothetical protein [Acetivibrio saccincola]|uniref:Uncharacterized protein n=1 Tax=Acetivibrio saccincola TaxID=1677857 RepID=A0A2S8R998_9FIRM|nr:hypothetical protein [Acetivibrio saccincola]PQQ66360.1 hypothetical protein B9R14_06080 [Acetivibrio saccincola]